MSKSSEETVTQTVVVKPENRYQITIGQDVRETLGFDGEKASLEVEIGVNKVFDEDQPDEESTDE